RDERAAPAAEHQDVLLDLLGMDVSGTADGAEVEELEAEAKDARPPASARASAVPASGRPGAAAAGSAPARPEPGFSRDRVDTYLRQMGQGELLTREEEIALAKRIEAAQLAVVQSLCRIPVVIARIDAWGKELRAGRMPLGQLIDVSMPCGEEARRDQV